MRTAGDAGGDCGWMAIEVETDLARCADEWLAFTASAHASPYQTFDWIEAWWRLVEAREGGALQIVRLMRGDALLALLPLVTRQHLGVRVASLIGGSRFNVQTPLWSNDFSDALAEAPVETLLRRVGRVIGVDAIELTHLPRVCCGADNPFVTQDAAECPSPTFILPLSPDFEAVSQARRSNKSLQQLRRKRKKLEAEAGPARFARASDEAEASRVVDAAIRHRAARRIASGVPSFFDAAGGEAFIRETAARGVGCETGCSSLMNAHYLEAGGRIVATYFGASHAGFYSCYVNSFDGDFDVFSPGDILLHDLIEAMCAKGLTALDLGVGQERYKQSWCDRIPLFQTTTPVTPRGWIYMNAARLSQDGKKFIKQNETLWRGWRSVRRLATRVFP